MFKIQVDKKFPAFVTFDGLVLEYFSEYKDHSDRYHAGLIKTIEITTDKKGRKSLELNTSRASLKQELDEEVVGEVRELVEAVQKAMASFK